MKTQSAGVVAFVFLLDPKANFFFFSSLLSLSFSPTYLLAVVGSNGCAGGTTKCCCFFFLLYPTTACITLSFLNDFGFPELIQLLGYLSSSIFLTGCVGTGILFHGPSIPMCLRRTSRPFDAFVENVVLCVDIEIATAERKRERESSLIASLSCSLCRTCQIDNESLMTAIRLPRTSRKDINNPPGGADWSVTENRENFGARVFVCVSCAVEEHEKKREREKVVGE